MLSAFESAARLGSFSRAANELNLTQGAISRQVRALEEQLDTELFERTHQQVILTSSGMYYANEITTALNIIKTATLKTISNSAGGELKLAILPALGTKWLIPRLSDFLEKNQDINIGFKTEVAAFDFHGTNIDAAIHYGQADWPNADCTFLMAETVYPVYSPLLLEKYSICSLQDFKKTPLLHLSTRLDHWSKWFHINGMEHDASEGLNFEQFSTLAPAAVAGLGVALMPKLFVENELKNGSLLCFDEGECKSSSAYYLVTPKHRTHYAPVKIFREWILEQAKGYYIS